METGEPRGSAIQLLKINDGWLETMRLETFYNNSGRVLKLLFVNLPIEDKLLKGIHSVTILKFKDESATKYN